MKKIGILAIICVFIALFTGCSEYLPSQSRVPNSGEVLTPEYMAEISQALADESTTDDIKSSNVVDHQTSDFQNNTTSAAESIADNLSEGDDAVESDTEVQADDEQAGAITTQEGTDNDIVYWTPGGSVWHIKKDCSSLARSKEIISGSEELAIEAGKERACKRCG